MPDEHSRPVEAASAPRPGEPAGSALITGSAPRRKSPLITAVEIENFKGIGPPVRIDLRPITLLFGRNSAGKSTVIQALCYAHEILCHGNVDAVKTEIGGDQIDVGGFRNFVPRARPRTGRQAALRVESWGLERTCGAPRKDETFRTR